MKAFKFSNKSKIIIGSVFLFLFLIFHVLLVLYQSHSILNQSTKNSKHSHIIIEKLREINDSLILMKTNSSMSHHQQNLLLKLEKDFASLEASIVDVAKSSELKDVSTLVTTMKNDVNSQFGDLKKMISGGNKEYLDVSSLPFHIISVDVIGGQAYATVDYVNRVFPLSIGDTVAGWRLNQADYDLHVVEFVNEKNQFVKANLKSV